MGGLNRPPTADAGEDREVFLSDVVVLEGEGRDPDGDPLIFRWELLERPADSNAQVDDPDRARTTVTIDRAGRYRIVLVVSDGYLESAPSEIVLTTTNRAPVANAGRISVSTPISQSRFAEPDRIPTGRRSPSRGR